MFFSIVITFFAMMAAVEGTTTVTCHADKIVVEHANGVHTTASSKGTMVCAEVADTAPASDGASISIEIPFTATACFPSTPDPKAGGDVTIHTNAITFSAINGLKTVTDAVVTASCTYNFDDKTDTDSVTFTGKIQNDIAAQDVKSLTPTITFVKESDVTADVTAYNFNDDTGKICLHVHLAPTIVVVDINLKSVIFSSDATFTDASPDIKYVSDYCPQAGTSINSLVDTIGASGACKTGSDETPANCPGTRVLCFQPFYFNAATSLHVQVIVTPESIAGFRTGTACESTMLKFGRKKRETDIDTDEYTGTAMLFFPVGGSNLEAVLTPKTCETEVYVIGLVVVSAAFVLTAIAAVFSFFCHYKNNNKAFA